MCIFVYIYIQIKIYKDIYLSIINHMKSNLQIKFWLFKALLKVCIRIVSHTGLKHFHTF